MKLGWGRKNWIALVAGMVVLGNSAIRMFKSKYKSNVIEDVEKISEGKNLNISIDDALKKLSDKVDSSNKEAWFRFSLAAGYAMIAMGLGVGFSSTEVLVNPLKGIIAFGLFMMGAIMMFEAFLKHRPEGFHRRTGYLGIIIVSIGVLVLLVEAMLKTEYDMVFPNLIPYSILACVLGSMVIAASSFKFRK